MNDQIIRSLFYQMLRIRMVEERIAKEYPKGQIRCPVHLCIGQEAVAAGVCANLKKRDKALSGHRSHGHYLAKGGSLKAMIAEIYGKETGCSSGRGGSQHLIDLSVNFLGATPIVGETIPIAVGAAFADNYKNKKNITAVFFGDGAMEEGTTHESLNFAALKHLPVLFVCENNLYSVYTHIRDRQPKREIYKLAQAHGMPAFQEDGNDVLKVFRIAKKATSIIKAKGGPVFIEFLTYRHREHVGPNFDQKGYREEKELDSWMKKCPLKKITNYILEKGIVTTEDVKIFKNNINKEIEKAFLFAKESAFSTEIPEEKQAYYEDD